MTSEAGDTVHNELPELDDSSEVAEYLRNYAYKQLTMVLTLRLMQLRCLVIGEVSRFPELAKVLYERGPQRALTALATAFERLAARGLLVIDDPLVAASQFNWLIMSDPLNQATLLGDEAIPTQVELRRHAACARFPSGIRQAMTIPWRAKTSNSSTPRPPYFSLQEQENEVLERFCRQGQNSRKITEQVGHTQNTHGVEVRNKGLRKLNTH